MLESHSRRGSGLLVALALVAVVVAAGCSDNPEPAPMPPASSSSSSSPSPTKSDTPKPPALPDEAKGTSAASAKAFARHWIATLNYSGPTGNTRALRELFVKKCVPCTGIGDFIDKVYAKGGSIEGRGWNALSTRVVSQSSEKTVVDVLVRVSPQTVIEAKGREPRQFDGGRRVKTFWLTQQRNAWTVTWLEQPS